MKVGSIVRVVGSLSRRGDVGVVTYIGPWRNSIEVHVLYTNGMKKHQHCERMFEVINEDR